MTQFCISIAVFVAPLFAGLALQISKKAFGQGSEQQGERDR